MKTIITRGLVLIGDELVKRDIELRDGVITAISERAAVGTVVSGGEPGVCRDFGTDVKVIDARGLVVLPGLIDAHCHLREPGFEYKEDIESGTRAAAKGGFTTVACMPNTDPATDNGGSVGFILDRAAKVGAARVAPIGAITKGLCGSELAGIGEMYNAGAVAVSDDGRPVVDGALMKKAMQYAKMFDIPLISHCESLDIVESGDMNDGLTSTELGLRGIPWVAEAASVARDVFLAEYTGARAHIAHVSVSASIDMIRLAKRRGARVTCETCPHYFTLTDKACLDFNTSAKVNPPLATAADVKAVIAALADGTIDIIATDHAPHHIDEKRVEFSRASNGIAGFETAFGLAYTRLVKTGALTLPQLVEKMSKNPARLLGMDKSRGEIGVGKYADITIVDLESEYIVDPSAFVSKARFSPFAGMKLFGEVVAAIVGGEEVYRHAKFHG